MSLKQIKQIFLEGEGPTLSCCWCFTDFHFNVIIIKKITNTNASCSRDPVVSTAT